MGWLVTLLLLVLVGGPILTGCFGFLLLLGSSGSDSGSQVTEQYHSLSKTGSDKIAIIRVEGTILDGEGYVKHQIDHVREDKSVKAVVLRVDSPGGSVTGSDYILHHLNKLCDEKAKDLKVDRLPLVVSMGGMAASGGYYVSMACGKEKDVIFAEPTTWTGSIGVVIPHYNVAGLMETAKVEEDSVKSHPLKQMGAPTRKMTEQERAIFQELVDDSFRRFKQIIQAGRPAFAEDPQALDKLATGQVFTTGQAIAAGLVDKEGFVEEAIERAIALANLKKDSVKVVQYKRQIGLFDSLIATQAAARPRSIRQEVAALLDLTTPRAYYLCSWLPDAMLEPRRAD